MGLKYGHTVPTKKTLIPKKSVAVAMRTAVFERVDRVSCKAKANDRPNIWTTLNLHRQQQQGKAEDSTADRANGDNRTEDTTAHKDRRMSNDALSSEVPLCGQLC